MLEEEGLDNVFARHDRLAEATRRAVRAWGLDFLSVDPQEHSSALTAVMMPEGHNADAVRAAILERYDLSLGAGLGKVAGKVFRIGHLGWFNDLMLMGTLGRGRDGARRGRRAAPQGRGRGGDGLSRRQPLRRPAGARRDAMSAAALLVDARRSGRRLAALPDDVVPRDDAEAYAVQDEVMALLGATIAGWKVGAPSPTAPPSAAPLLADLVAPSPATFAATSESFRAVEAELALTLARDLPARSGNPYGEDEAWDAVAAVHVAIELLDSRFVDRVRMSPPALLADKLSNGGFTFGPAIAVLALDRLAGAQGEPPHQRQDGEKCGRRQPVRAPAPAPRLARQPCRELREAAADGRHRDHRKPHRARHRASGRPSHGPVRGAGRGGPESRPLRG